MIRHMIYPLYDIIKNTKGVTAVLLNIGNERKIHDIPIVRIKPCRVQSRKIFSAQEIKELAQSIKMNGILQPLTVRKISSGEYELIAGERRLRAAAMCGNRKVPCIIINCSDKQADQYSLIENLQKSNLNFFEEAEGIERLMKTYNMSRIDVSRRLGKKQSEIANKLKLLTLSPEEKEIITKYKLTEKHTKALLKIENIRTRKLILNEIIEKRLNVTQSEKYIDSVLSEKSKDKIKTQKTRLVIKDIKILENTINKAVDFIRSTGIEAVTGRCETEDFIEYSVRIPKNRTDNEPDSPKTA